jgi:hypothetical protein
MKKIIFFFAALIITVTSCRKDIYTNDTIYIPIGEDVTTNLHGRVLDINGRSISEAEIVVKDLTTFTNGDGYFYMPNISVPIDGFTINVRSQNNDKILKRVIPQAETNTYEEIVLLDHGPFMEYSSNKSEVVLDSARLVSVTIGPGSLVDGNNNLYTGTYLARITYYNPTLINTLRALPGNLDGISKQGKKVSLGSFGMFNIEVTDSNGEALNLTSGKTASAELVLPPFFEVPNIVPTWQLDESTGIWLEFDQADFVRLSQHQAMEDLDIYQFEIDNFSYWACDILEQNTCLTGTITDTAGLPIENRFIHMTFEVDGNSFQTTGGNTNSNGEFIAKVPQDREITLKIYDNYCRKVIHTEKIGIFSGEATDINVILPPADDIYSITGSIVSCTNEILYANASVFLYDLFGTLKTITQTNEDGSFSLHSTCFTSFEELGFRLGVINHENNTNFITGEYLGTDIDIVLENIFPCEDMTEYINVVSEFGELTFDVSSVSFNTDSLFMEGSIGQTGFILFASGSEVGVHPVNLLQIQINEDQILTCTSQYSHTNCNEAVVFTITENNADLRYITGDISGLLYYGEISEPNLTQGTDVSINFRVNY